MKYKLIILFFLLPFSMLSSQKATSLEIDNYMKKAEEAKNSNSDLDFLKYSKKANLLAIESQNSEMIAKSYFYLATALYLLEIRKESFVYTEKALQQDFTKKDKALKSRLYELKSLNYAALNLYDMAVEESDKIIKIISPSESDPEMIETLASAYNCKGVAYYMKTGKLDSVNVYLNTELNLLKNKPEKLMFRSLSQAYLNKSTFLDLSKQNDSALLYIKKAFAIREKYDPKLISYDLNISLGEYYFNINEKGKALEYYLKGIHEMKNLDIKDYGYSNAYKDVSELYGILGNPEKEKQYLKLYVQETERLQKKQKENTIYALKIINEKKEEQYKVFKNKIYLVLAFVIILLSVLMVLLLRKRKKEKDLLQEKQDIIIVKEEENIQLQLKLNESFNEVIQLAKSNSPEFFTRFREVYPEFVSRLLEVNPKLSIPELTLSAYIFLGFSTKDIVAITFTSINTVKSRKYYLRKKLNIPANSTTEMWIKNLEENS